MKKVAIALLVLVVAIVVAGPWYGARKTEDALNQLLAYFNASPGYSASWVSYNKGWLTTDATMQLVLEGLSETGEEGRLPIVFHVNHGPLLMSDGFKPGWFSGHMGLGQELEGWLRENVVTEADGPLWRAEFRMNLAGELRFSDRAERFTLRMEDQTITVEPYSGSGQYSAAGRLSYRGELPALRIESEGQTVLAERMAIETELDFGARYGKAFVPGSGKLTLGSVSGATADSETFALAGLSFASTGSINEDRTMADIGLSARLDSFALADDRVADAVFESRFERISLEFLKQYTEATEAMSEAQQVELGAAGMQLMQPVMTELLPNAPRWVIDPLAFTSTNGDLNLTLDLKVEPSVAGVNNILAVLKHVRLNATAVTDKALALKLLEQQTRQEVLARQFETGKPLPDEELEKTVRDQAQFKLNLLVIQRMLVVEKGKYVAKLELKDGKATINGQPLPLPF